MKKLSILGSTGSIGQSTLDVVERHPEKFSIIGLAEGHDVKLLARQIERHRPRLVSVRDESSLAKLKGLLGARMPEAVFGIEGACQVAGMNDANLVVSAIVGSAGLRPTAEAIKAGKQVALANKESLVVAGGLITELCKRHGVRIIPIDSEHSAIFQSMEGHRREDVRRLILTASGGPFLRASADEIENASPKQALKHPRWQMGAKITIDSASLMNKGLEVIEARWLFGMPCEKIGVVVHPQSIVHSMVEYTDGCVVAELGVPDMRAPIAYALSYPLRVESGTARLDLAKAGALTFEEPDFKRFPCLQLAFDAITAGRSMPAVLNAANEVAVDAFLKGQMKFGKIPVVIAKTMGDIELKDCRTIEEYMEADREAREKTRGFV